MLPRPPRPPLFPYTTLFRSLAGDTTDTPGRYAVAISTGGLPVNGYLAISDSGHHMDTYAYPAVPLVGDITQNVLMVSGSEDRKSTRLNSSHRCISYAVFCLK